MEDWRHCIIKFVIAFLFTIAMAISATLIVALIVLFGDLVSIYPMVGVGAALIMSILFVYIYREL